MRLKSTPAKGLIHYIFLWIRPQLFARGKRVTYFLLYDFSVFLFIFLCLVAVVYVCTFGVGV